jgi:hypothetical protein
LEKNLSGRRDEKMKVLVTGANGFIAAHCISVLLCHSHQVRATVRSETKATTTRRALLSAGIDITNLELVVITDPTDEAQFSPVVKDCDAILHLASVFNYDAKPGEFEAKLIIPAVQGTVTVCRAAASEPAVKKVVVMSSFAAVYDAASGPQPGKIYTEADWSPLTYEQGRDAEAVVFPLTLLGLQYSESDEFAGNCIPCFQSCRRTRSMGVHCLPQSPVYTCHAVSWDGIWKDDPPA